MGLAGTVLLGARGVSFRNGLSWRKTRSISRQNLDFWLLLKEGCRAERDRPPGRLAFSSLSRTLDAGSFFHVPWLAATEIQNSCFCFKVLKFWVSQT